MSFRHRCEAKVSFVLAANSLDEAYGMQKQIADIVERHTNERVTEVSGSMLDLRLAASREERQRG